MRRVLITMAGGRLGIGVTRALKSGHDPVFVVGVDSNPYMLQRSLADELRLIPRATETDFIEVLARVAEETRADVLWPNHEAEIAALASEPGLVCSRLFLPSYSTVQICQDKFACFKKLEHAGVPTPRGMMLTTVADLREAFRILGSDIWIRATKGAGGKGSLPVSDFRTAASWIDLYQGWGQFMAAERLTEETVTCESVWAGGRLIFSQGRRRLYWEFSSLTMSGVTGICGAQRWVSDPVVDEVSCRAIQAVDPAPHGVFGVDMTYGQDGLPRVTEINCGRFMSGGAIHAAIPGANLSHLIVQIALGGPALAGAPMLNPLPEDQITIHGMDVEPVVVDAREIEKVTEGLARLRDRVPALARVN